MNSNKPEFYNINYTVGIVECSEVNLKIKIGRTEELCNSSVTLCFKKYYPFLFNCHYKSIEFFKQQILEVLKRNNYDNFGSCENTVPVKYYIEYRFAPESNKIPITRI